VAKIGRAGVTMAGQYRLGAIAQLGERLHGMQEVAGSSPASSTRRTPANVGVSSLEGSEYWMRITAILRFGPVFGPMSALIDRFSQDCGRAARPSWGDWSGASHPSPRCAARSSAADEEVVEGPSDLLAIPALEDLRVDLQGDLRVAVSDLGHDVEDLRAGGEPHRDVARRSVCAVTLAGCGGRSRSARRSLARRTAGRITRALMLSLSRRPPARVGKNGLSGAGASSDARQASSSSRSIGLRSTCGRRPRSWRPRR
jgi:hypothetical protein